VVPAAATDDRPVGIVPEGDVEVDTQVCGNPADGVAEGAGLAVQLDEHAQYETAADDDLLDVTDLDVVTRQGAEQPGGDAGSVGARDGEKRPEPAQD